MRGALWLLPRLVLPPWLVLAASWLFPGCLLAASLAASLAAPSLVARLGRESCAGALSGREASTLASPWLAASKAARLERESRAGALSGREASTCGSSWVAAPGLLPWLLLIASRFPKEKSSGERGSTLGKN